jgi:hypothetical protein
MAAGGKQYRLTSAVTEMWLVKACAPTGRSMTLGGFCEDWGGELSQRRLEAFQAAGGVSW